MKSLFISALVATLFNFQIDHVNNNESNLLDGTSVTYSYEDLGTVKLDFYNGFITYEWLEGAFVGMIVKDHSYKVQKIGKKMYLINWYEDSRSSLVTLVLDFKENKVYSSALLNPKTEKEVVLFHHAVIKKQHLIEN